MFVNLFYFSYLIFIISFKLHSIFISFYLSLAEISTVICDNEEKTLALINDKNEMPTLKLIVQIAPISDSAKEKAKQFDVDLMSFKEMEVCMNYMCFS